MFAGKELGNPVTSCYALFIGTSRSPEGVKMSTTATAPTYRTMTLARAAAKGMRPQNWPAKWVHEVASAKEGGVVRLWQSFGHINGQEMFGTHYFRAAADSVECVTADGQVVSRYPLEPTPSQAGYRTGIRVLVR